MAALCRLRAGGLTATTSACRCGEARAEPVRALAVLLAACLLRSRDVLLVFLFQARDLASAGFFFTPTPACPDRVTCAYCGLELGDWTSDKNIAWEAHSTGNPACPFLSGLVTDIDADPEAAARRATGKRTTEAPVLKDCVWFVNQYVDLPGGPAAPVLVTNESVSNDVRIDSCEGEA